ncbi:MAG: very short patch repair endonuclease [Nitrosotalea sp.]
MADKFSRKIRSEIMSKIRSKNTKPEITIRKILWSKGKRYRVHDRSIFGTPDISSKSKKIVVFIDGCFWHGCKRCYTEPKTNVEFWRNKILQNKRRRELVSTRLKQDGFKTLTFWEHDVMTNPELIANRISKLF